MYYYRIYGMKMETDMEFRQLVACEDDSAVDITVVEGTISEDIYNELERRNYVFEERFEIQHIFVYGSWGTRLYNELIACKFT